MKSWLRWTLFGVLGLVAVGAVAVAWGVHRSEHRLARTLSLPAYALQLPAGEPALAPGRYLCASRGCAQCRGPNGAGRAYSDDAKAGMYAKAPNISPGAGSVVSAYQASGWERAVRHGLRPDGRPLLIM